MLYLKRQLKPYFPIAGKIVKTIRAKSQLKEARGCDRPSSQSPGWVMENFMIDRCKKILKKLNRNHYLMSNK